MIVTGGEQDSEEIPLSSADQCSLRDPVNAKSEVCGSLLDETQYLVDMENTKKRSTMVKSPRDHSHKIGSKK